MVTIRHPTPEEELHWKKERELNSLFNTQYPNLFTFEDPVYNVEKDAAIIFLDDPQFGQKLINEYRHVLEDKRVPWQAFQLSFNSCYVRSLDEQGFKKWIYEDLPALLEGKVVPENMPDPVSRYRVC